MDPSTSPRSAPCWGKARGSVEAGEDATEEAVPNLGAFFKKTSVEMQKEMMKKGDGSGFSREQSMGSVWALSKAKPTLSGLGYDVKSI